MLQIDGVGLLGLAAGIPRARLAEEVLDGHGQAFAVEIGRGSRSRPGPALPFGPCSSGGLRVEEWYFRFDPGAAGRLLDFLLLLPARGLQGAK